MNAQKTEFTPKWDIPDLWASNGHCPACGVKALKATHLLDYPDYLACSHCEISFEVEKGGRTVRIKNVPDRYEFAEEMLYRKWVEASAVHEIIESRRRPAALVETQAMPKTPITDEEVWKRADTMSRMGNKPGVIEMILQQRGATHQQAIDAVSRLKRKNQVVVRQQSNKILMIAGISTFLLVGAVAVYLFFNFDELTSTPPPQPAAGSNPLSRALDLLPSDIQPELLDLPDTVVRTGGVADANCPTTSGMAARTFGGVPSVWEKTTQYPAWQMVSVNKSFLIHVPPGMSAGYIENQTFQFLSVYGPALITNANFVVINCE